MSAATKPCLICRTPLPVDGPTLCEEHRDESADDLYARYADVAKPETNKEAWLYFWQVGDSTCSTFRTNLTPRFCRVHWFAHEGDECPACHEDQIFGPSDAAPVLVDEPTDCTPPVLAATDQQLSAAGWSRSVEEHEEKHGSKRGRNMASKKAKNGETEANGDGAKVTGKPDPVKVINCTKMIRVRLTDAECRERGELAGAKKSERDALEEELDAHKKEQKGKIDALDAEIGTLLAQVYNGHESRAVNCRREYHYRTNTMRIVRVDNGEELESRAMLPEEQEEHAQVPLQAKGANEETAKPEGEKPKRGRKKKGAAAEQSVGPAE